MNQRGLFLVLAIAILNGIFSPATFTALLLHPLWYPGFLPQTLPVVLMLSSLLTATLTVMLSGVPAALYERLASGASPRMPRTSYGSLPPHSSPFRHYATLWPHSEAAREDVSWRTANGR
jgi:hypothetical protein